MSDQNPKLTLNKKSAATRLDIGLTALNALITSGRLRTIHLAGRVLIPVEALEALAKDGDGLPLRRGYNAAEAGRKSAENRAKRWGKERAPADALPEETSSENA
jgi:hypothetical protein